MCRVRIVFRVIPLWRQTCQDNDLANKPGVRNAKNKQCQNALCRSRFWFLRVCFNTSTFKICSSYILFLDNLSEQNLHLWWTYLHLQRSNSLFPDCLIIYTQKMNETWQKPVYRKPFLLFLMWIMHHIIQTIHTLSNAVSKFKTIKIAISNSIFGHANGISGWVKLSYFQGYRFTFSWCRIRISDNKSCYYDIF
jgi:hypothetical protein